MNSKYVTACFLSLSSLIGNTLDATKQRLSLEIKPIGTKVKQVHANSDYDSIVAASITFIKHYPKSLHLNGFQTIKIGCPPSLFPRLEGTLYQANNKNKLTVSQEYVVGDGVWDEKMNQLNITFEKPISLTVRSTFYLVLTVPHNSIHTLDKQTISITTQNFPFISEHHKCFCQIRVPKTKNSLIIS